MRGAGEDRHERRPRARRRAAPPPQARSRSACRSRARASRDPCTPRRGRARRIHAQRHRRRRGRRQRRRARRVRARAPTTRAPDRPATRRTATPRPPPQAHSPPPHLQPRRGQARTRSSTITTIAPGVALPSAQRPMCRPARLPHVAHCNSAGVFPPTPGVRPVLASDASIEQRQTARFVATRQSCRRNRLVVQVVAPALIPYGSSGGRSGRVSVGSAAWAFPKGPGLCGRLPRPVRLFRRTGPRWAPAAGARHEDSLRCRCGRIGATPGRAEEAHAHDHHDRRHGDLL
jgi:hypothetical protein